MASRMPLLSAPSAVECRARFVASPANRTRPAIGSASVSMSSLVRADEHRRVGAAAEPVALPVGDRERQWPGHVAPEDLAQPRERERQRAASALSLWSVPGEGAAAEGDECREAAGSGCRSIHRGSSKRAVVGEVDHVGVGRSLQNGSSKTIATFSTAPNPILAIAARFALGRRGSKRIDPALEDAERHRDHDVGSAQRHLSAAGRGADDARPGAPLDRLDAVAEPDLAWTGHRPDQAAVAADRDLALRRSRCRRPRVGPGPVAQGEPAPVVAVRRARRPGGSGTPPGGARRRSGRCDPGTPARRRAPTRAGPSSSAIAADLVLARSSGRGNAGALVDQPDLAVEVRVEEADDRRVQLDVGVRAGDSRPDRRSAASGCR